jgi:hypothetical protein
MSLLGLMRLRERPICLKTSANNLSGCWTGIVGHSSLNPVKVSGYSSVDASVFRISAAISVGGDANLNSVNEERATAVPL